MSAGGSAEVRGCRVTRERACEKEGVRVDDAMLLLTRDQISQRRTAGLASLRQRACAIAPKIRLDGTI